MASPRLPGARWSLWLALLGSWLVLLPLLWLAFATVPSPDRLERSHMAAIPTLATLAWTAGRSLLELGALLALLWPRARLYLTRLWLAALGASAWFVASAPLSLNRLAWTHRRWLALVAAALLLSALAAALARLSLALRHRR